jgi:hypothetical protein
MGKLVKGKTGENWLRRGIVKQTQGNTKTRFEKM